MKPYRLFAFSILHFSFGLNGKWKMENEKCKELLGPRR